MTISPSANLSPAKLNLCPRSSKFPTTIFKDLRTYRYASAYLYSSDRHSVRKLRARDPLKLSQRKSRGLDASFASGEQPGWTGVAWANLEINQANVWNTQADIRDKRTGSIYTYKADFEQSAAILELGAPISEDFAVTLELPFAARNGGFLDDIIDQFHVLIQSDRFLRHINEEFANSYVIKKDGVDQLSTDRGSGVVNAKIKAKYWPLKWQSNTLGACDCGFAVSGQVKFPVQSRKFGLSSGGVDYSALLHLGIPLGQHSAILVHRCLHLCKRKRDLRRLATQRVVANVRVVLGPGVGAGMGIDSPSADRITVLQQRAFELPIHVQHQARTNGRARGFSVECPYRVARVAIDWLSLSVGRRQPG